MKLAILMLLSALMVFGQGEAVPAIAVPPYYCSPTSCPPTTTPTYVISSSADFYPGKISYYFQDGSVLKIDGDTIVENTTKDLDSAQLNLHKMWLAASKTQQEQAQKSADDFAEYRRLTEIMETNYKTQIKLLKEALALREKQVANMLEDLKKIEKALGGKK